MSNPKPQPASWIKKYKKNGETWIKGMVTAPSSPAQEEGWGKEIKKLSDMWFETHSGDGLGRLETEDIIELDRFIRSLLQKERQRIRREVGKMKKSNKFNVLNIETRLLEKDEYTPKLTGEKTLGLIGDGYSQALDQVIKLLEDTAAPKTSKS